VANTMKKKKIWRRDKYLLFTIRVKVDSFI